MAETTTPDLIEIQTTVREFFGWDYQSDLQSANLLAEAFSDACPFNLELWSVTNRNRALERLRQRLLSASKVVIIGASVSEEDFVDFDFENSAIIAADGAVGAIDELAKLACVVTDFDGNPHLDRAAKSGTTFVAHAHGDNIPQWQDCLSKWRDFQHPPELILTHQVAESIDGVYNFGGFTDGDRAVCLAIGLGVAKENITLLGFSTSKIGKWSGQTNPKRKLAKLAWMLRVLQIIGLEEQVDTNAFEVL